MKRKLTSLCLALVITGSAFQFLSPQSAPIIVVSADNSIRDEATRINLNQSYDDSLLSSADVNWYMFSIDEDGVVVIDFEREVKDDQNLYWTATLYKQEENLNELASVSFNQYSKLTESPEYGLSSGIYYIAVEAYHTNSYGGRRYSDSQYSLTVNYESSDYWEKEFNSTTQTATPLLLGQSYQGSVHDDSDDDWYTFTVEENGTFSLDFEREVTDEKDLFWTVTLYKQEENLNTITSYSYDKYQHKTSTPELGLSAGVYYFLVESYHTNSYGGRRNSDSTYTLTLNYEPSDSWEKEFNSTTQEATFVSFNKQYFGSLYDSSDLDWYTFTVTEDGYVSLDFLREVTDDSDLYWTITLYKQEENLNQMTAWNFNKYQSKTSTPEIGLSPGKYYFMVEAYHTNTYGGRRCSTETYSFTVHYKESPNWEKEFNETSQTASAIEVNKRYSASLYDQDDVDWYVFSVEQNGYIALELGKAATDDSDLYFTFTIYKKEENMNEFSSWDASKFNSKTLSPEIGITKGTYYVKMEAYHTNSYGGRRYSGETYALTVHYHSSDYWEKEFNNTSQDATAIMVNKPYHGSLYSTNDTDWYRFELKAATNVNLHIVTNLIGDDRNHWNVRLYQRTESLNKIKEWSVSGLSTEVTLSDVLLETGIYYVEISRYGESYQSYYSSQTYQLTIQDGTAVENIMGDVNLDGSFNVADVVLLQKWLLAAPEVTLEKWENADFFSDGKLDVFDLCLMKRAIVTEA